MEDTSYRAIAIVGAGAVLPDAPNVPAFWKNIQEGRYSITEVDRDRWDPGLYYDPDPAAPDKTYSKIGGWVREFAWDPVKWHLPVPPRVVEGMDGAQKWAIACTREALEDYGYPQRPLDPNRTAVILGNAMAGEKHYLTAIRVYFPEYARELSAIASFASLPEAIRNNIVRELHDRMAMHLPAITEDSMPGELANCIAGRIANLFNFHGPNYVCDAACASAMAAISAAVEGLVDKDFDAVITGGIDRNMGASTFVKFCKIGALSATGTRPYAEGADGFVMGEGAAIFLLKRLADAERDGDKVYAVLRGIAGSSDGRGKGITAPNPVGQKMAIERAWQNAALSPATASYIEGHGTSTRVGDVVEVQSMAEVLSSYHMPPNSVGLGSVKSNFGHLKGAAGAAGFLKTVLAIRDKVLPPSVHCERPNPDIDFAHSPLYVNRELMPWIVPANGIRRAGLSAFGFGGTNFHAVLEEYIPHRLNGNGRRSAAVPATSNDASMSVKPSVSNASSPSKLPLRGALVIGAASIAELAERLRSVEREAKAGRAPVTASPAARDLSAQERLAIDYLDVAELATKAATALKALAAEQSVLWKALRTQGIFRGHGPAAKVAFLYPGQGSQYVNMLRPLRDREPIVEATFAEADRIMAPLLGKPLTEFIFVDYADKQAVATAENDLRQTAVTQPAVLASDLALTRLLAAYGVVPDFTMGHSLGEYGALVASGGIPFADALEAVSARGREMTRVALADNGQMAAVFGPLEEIDRLLKTTPGYVVIANINSGHQAVIGGATSAVQQAMDRFQKAGYEVSPLPVSHAFHTSIVAPASEPLRRVLERLRLEPPRIPIVANTNGQFYPTGADVVPQMVEILARQVASPVQFVTGLRTLYDAGARVFVEVGPKKALQGFAEDVLGGHGDVLSLFTNHPKVGDIPAFNQALCGLYAAGLGTGTSTLDQAAPVEVSKPTNSLPRPEPSHTLKQREESFGNLAQGSVEPSVTAELMGTSRSSEAGSGSEMVMGSLSSPSTDQYLELGRFFSDVLERGWQMTHGAKQHRHYEPVAITGAALGLPGGKQIFDDSNVSRLLAGEQFIGSIPERFRRAMLDKHITRVVKNENGGTFESITNLGDVIKLAGRGGVFDLESEFGVSGERRAALDRTTQLAMAVGLDALRDAGIPLLMKYKNTSKGTQLPDRWMLPDILRDDTGVIFASAFPGLDSFAEEMSRYYSDQARREQLATLEALRTRMTESNGSAIVVQEIERRIRELRDAIAKAPYVFDRRYLFRVLPMGHSQFAEFIGARGPNTQVNSACASTTQAVGLAEDWIRAGRCRRVVIVSADDITTDHLMEWMGAGFLASGAAATDDIIENAALPFDRRRHGMIIGMGAAGLVLESAEAARERGVRPICEVLSAVTANSAFHGTRLDVQHISKVMEDLVAKAELGAGIHRGQIAPKTVFVSHETYTPARGGSAQAEIHALRKVFGDAANQIVITNTKGFTGHAMGAGVEDVVAVKALETGIVPAVANFKEVDPELGTLNLSKGGSYPVEYALRLGAGFGSQISMTLLRWANANDDIRRSPNSLGYAYRIFDMGTWNTWLSRLAGHPVPALEIVHRTLRIPDRKANPNAVTEAAPQSGKASVRGCEPSGKVQTRAVAQSPEPVTVTVNPDAKATSTKASPATEQITPGLILAKVEPQTKSAAPSTTATVAARTQSLMPDTGNFRDGVKDRILALAVEKTGYPEDMLDLDLDLEADLGVDTVKQAEMFAAIREMYNIPRDETRKLRDYPTLAHVIRFVHEKRPDLAVAPLPSAQSEMKLAEAHPTKDETTGTVAVTTPSATALVANSRDAVKHRILALVVEKTGYPEDMLDLDLDLEADLGVDTVKQAEMFAAIREMYNIPRDETRKLRDYPTLAHVIRFVYERRPDLAVALPAAQAETKLAEAQATEQEIESTAPANAPFAGEDVVKDRILALVVEKTGYPKDMLDLDLDLEADLGVDTVKQAEMFAAIREMYNIPRDETRKLRDYPTLAHVIRFVYERRPDLAVALPAAQAETKLAQVHATQQEIVSTAQASAPFAGEDVVKDRILALVVEKTGYPKDMLDLDLDLEADLGVDTVKQAEMFAAIREMYNIPRDETRKLRDYPTLAHVIRFVYEKRPDLAPAVPSCSVTEPSENVSSEHAMAAAASQPLAPSTPSQLTSSIEEAIKEKVLEIVAEKTGYPKDMLDLDLDLEADLGVDTVKQAEMFAAIRAFYNIPRDEALKLRDFPTLCHVIKFAQDRSGLVERDTKRAESSVKHVEPLSNPSSGSVFKPKVDRAALVSLDAANSVPRRVPLPVLRPPLDSCKATGVRLERGSRVIVMPDNGGVADTVGKLLETRGVEVLRIAGGPEAGAIDRQIQEWLAKGTVDGVYWLPALDPEGSFTQMDLPTWHDAVRIRIKSLYTTMRALYQHVAKPGTFLISATRLGGQHGYDEAGAFAPLGGAVVGFTKAYKRERAGLLAKAVDFEAAGQPSDVAGLLIRETLWDPGAVEIGYKHGLRWTIGLEEQPAVDGQLGMTLDQNSIFLITGAAGSIVSAITADLAAASAGTFYLLDLAPKPETNNPDLKRFVSDKETLKRDLFARIQASGQRATPALVEKELATLERAQAAQSAIDAVQTAGGTAYYFNVNLTDPKAVAEVIEEVRQRSGRIDVLLHAAGVERSRPLADKDSNEFDLVFDVKSDGFFNLLHALGDTPVTTTVVFSSIAGRFGNAGQTDYSAANDLLAKITSSFRTTRPNTRGIAIDWTAWAGIGMASRGSIPKIMEMAGIEMLAPEAGIPVVRRELISGNTRGEVLIAQKLGILLQEWDENGGVDPRLSVKPTTPTGPMFGKITSSGVFRPTTIEVTLDPKVQPFLYDHQIDNTSVLPGVMGIEAFAEAALSLAPGWAISAIEDVNFLAPFKFYRSEPRTLVIEVRIHSVSGGLISDCRLLGRRALANQTEPHVTLHFTARVRLTQQPSKMVPLGRVVTPTGNMIHSADIYRLYFHGPAYRVLEKAWWEGKQIVGLMAKNLPNNHEPSALPTFVAPRVIELCFQTAGIWEMGIQARMGLPLHIDQVLPGNAKQSVDCPLYAAVVPNPEQGSWDAEVIDDKGNIHLQLKGYRTVPVPEAMDPERLKTLGAAMSLESLAA